MYSIRQTENAEKSDVWFNDETEHLSLLVNLGLGIYK